MKNLQFSTERLEDRRMMAGDVSVSVSGGGDLVVNGDNDSNEVVIRPGEVDGSYIVEGVNGTTINGQSDIEVTGVTDDFRINLRNGDNNLLITGAPEAGDNGTIDIPDDISIRFGNGNDTFAGDNMNVGDDLILNSSSGNDAAIMFESSVNDRTTMNMGSGGDIVGLSDSTFGDDFRATMGSGNDAILSEFSTFDGDIDWRGGSGNDKFGANENEMNDGFTIRGNSATDEYFHNDNLGTAASTTSVENEQALAENDLYDEFNGYEDQILVGLGLVEDFGTEIF